MLSQLTAGKRLGSCPVKSARAAVGRQGVSADGSQSQPRRQRERRDGWQE